MRAGWRQRLDVLNAKYGPVPDDTCDEEWWGRRASLVADSCYPKLVNSAQQTDKPQHRLRRPGESQGAKVP